MLSMLEPILCHGLFDIGSFLRIRPIEFFGRPSARVRNLPSLPVLILIRPSGV